MPGPGKAVALLLRHNGCEFTHIFYNGKEEGTREVVVEFIVERNIIPNILEFKAVVERICVLTIKIRFRNISFIKMHAPTDEMEELKKKVFYQKV